MLFSKHLPKLELEKSTLGKYSALFKLRRVCVLSELERERERERENRWKVLKRFLNENFLTVYKAPKRLPAANLFCVKQKQTFTNKLN